MLRVLGALLCGCDLQREVGLHRSGPRSVLTLGWKHAVEPEFDVELAAESREGTPNLALATLLQVDAHAVTTGLEQLTVVEGDVGESCHDLGKLEVDPVLVECRYIPLPCVVYIVPTLPCEFGSEFELEVKLQDRPVRYPSARCSTTLSAGKACER